MNPPDIVLTRQVLTVLLPELILLGVAVVMMTLGAFIRLPRRAWFASSVAAVLVALLALVLLRSRQVDPYSSVVVTDALAWYGRLLFLLAGLLVLAMAHDQVEDGRAAEFFGSLLILHAGAMLVAAANELALLFIALELVSIPTYLLLYLPRRSPATQEAVTKYFYLSVFSSAVFLFGLAYLYGLTGISNLKALAYVLHAGANVVPAGLGLIALVFVVSGLSFRVAAVPFHFYAPDVYQGAPTVLAALLSWVPKAVGFLALMRALTTVLGGGVLAEKAVLLSAVLAIATMTLGNTVALVQNDLKRLLAYSSIAHAGYLMIGVAAAFKDQEAGSGAYLGGQGIVFYLVAYALMTLGAFAVILGLSTPERPVERVNDLVGLGRTRPWPALALAICLFSLTGVPPLAGFWGKYLIFASALSAGSEADSGLFLALAIIGGLNAAVGAYYYLRIVVLMYLRDPVDEALAPRPAGPTWLTAGLCAGLSLVLGMASEPVNFAARQAAVTALELPGPQPPAVAGHPQPDPLGLASREAP